MSSSAADASKRTAALASLIAGRDVSLRGDDDAPDRYGRQSAFVFVAGDDTSVQARLLSQGEAFSAADIADKECAATLLAAQRGQAIACERLAQPSQALAADAKGARNLARWPAFAAS